MDNRPPILKAAAIGGLSAGVAGAIPVVNFLNCLCCALVIGGGVLAAFLYSRDCRNQGFEFNAGNGALIGLIAGGFYAVMNTLASIPFRPSAEDIDGIIEQMESGGAPPEFIEQAAPWIEKLSGGGGIFLSFLFTLVIAAIFSTIGGLIGGAAFKVEAAPPAPPAPTIEAGPPA